MIETAWLAEFWPLLLSGLRRTVTLLAIAATAGFLLALPVAFALVSDVAPLRRLARGFTTLIRGTPLLVQLYILYYGLGTLLATTPDIRGSVLWPYLRDGFWYVALSLTISVAAYEGEIFRAGLLAVPPGQLEAARAYGMSWPMMARRIWLPAAFRVLLPTLSADLVMITKATSLASTVAVVDLLGAAGQVRTRTLLIYEPLVLVAVIYLVLSLGLGWAGGWLERRLAPRAG